jgi:general secretion pathway protein G
MKNSGKEVSRAAYSDRAGFTLIELMVVIVILSVLAMFIAPKMMSRTDDAKVVEVKVQIRNFETALKLFKIDNGFYPSTEQGLQALISKPTIGRTSDNYREGGYLEANRIKPDPWGNEYLYISPGLQNEYDILSYGDDGQSGGEGFSADILNWDM